MTNNDDGPGHTLRLTDLPPVAFAAFMTIVALFMLSMVPRLDAPLLIKMLVVILCASGVAMAISLVGWSRTYRVVGSPGRSFVKFVLAERPSHQEQVRLWLWGRRFVLAWAITLLCVSAVGLSLVLLGP